MIKISSRKRKSSTPASLEGLLIRKATPADLDGIRRIYNDAVRKTTATFDTQPRTATEQRRWFKKHGPSHPIMVAEARGRVVGWASLSPWSDRLAYSVTAEVSFYVEERSRGKGVGKKLLKAIVRGGKQAGLHSLLSRVTDESTISIHLHESLGFEHVGVMKEVGRKFGRLLDVSILQKIF